MSIPEDVYRATAALARRLGMSRSVLITRAAEEFLDQHGDDVAVNPLIRELVEPILAEELLRLEVSATVWKHEEVEALRDAPESAHRLR